MKRSDVDYNELSPMMKQYMDIKKDHEDELLFYRIGDFYELFFEDALEGSHALELTLTGKNAGLKERVPMCGVPHHASKAYIEKAVNLGYKVAVCEQVEDPRFTKGMVKREVISVVSKGTLVDLDFLSAYDFNFIGSILDLEYAYLITYADISTGNVYSELTTHDKNTLISRILNLNLKEVILTNTFDLEILNTLKNNYNLSISISDKFYEETTKLTDNITDDRVRDGVNHLLYYLIVRELKDITHLSNVVIIDNNARLRMDVHSVRNLEIFETLRLKERQYSLIWLIDKCKTSMGSRTLKSWLMNPLRNEKMINDRLDSIDKLNNEFIKRSELTKHLYEIYDLERLCGKAVCGSFNARDALQIKKSLEHLPYVKTLVSEIGLNIDINTHEELYKLLESSIYEDAPITLKDGYLIKEGYENLKKHGSKTFSTMLIICATMLVLGIFMILFTNVNKNVETVKVEQGIQAFIEDTATDADIEYIKDAIKKIDGVGEIRYISKDEAYEDAKNVFKDQEYFLEGLDKVQIFPASYVVKFADIEKADNIKSQIEKIDGIYKVKYNSSTINAVISISKIANIFLLGIGVVLLVVSIFIISNTIKLAVYSNKREIFIMRYIGATNKFIKKPFVIEGAIMGIVSALISFMLISIAYVVIYARIPKVGSSLGVFGFIPYTSLWWMILAIYIVLGLFIGILGSSISIKKYLKA